MSSLTIIPTNLSKPIKLNTKPTRTATILCSATSTNNNGSSERLSLSSSTKTFSAALALSSVLLSAPVVLPASADIAGFPYKESIQFPNREKQQIITKFALDNTAPALALEATQLRTAYDVLSEYNLPVGLLPQGVTGYNLNRSTGDFSVQLRDSCNLSIGGYNVKYDKNIKGKITNGKLYDLSGVSVKVTIIFSINININQVVRNDNTLTLYTSLKNASFPVDDFKTSPPCN